jgi:hypothetical protein
VDDTGKEVVDGINKWYVDTFSMKENKEVLDDNPKGIRDTAIEMPGDFNILSFNVGNIHEISRTIAGPTGNLNDEKLRRIQETHMDLLGDLLRPDQPIM